MSALATFTYGAADVRTVVVEGDVHFVLADLCTALDLTSPTRVAERIDPDALSSAQVIDSMGREQTVRTVTEAGMYEVVIRSDKPDAVAFRRFVTGTILPTIRKTGSYGTQAVAQLDRRALAAMVIEAEDRADAEAERRQIEAARADAAEDAVADMLPKAELADAYLQADGGNRLVRSAAKLLGMRESDLRAFLLAERLLIRRYKPCGDWQWEPYAEHAGTHFVTRETVVKHGDRNCSHLTVDITPRGIDLIRRRLAKDNLRSIGGGAA